MRHFEPAQIEADFLSRLKEMSEHDRNTARWLLENVNGMADRDRSGLLLYESYKEAIQKARTVLRETQTEED